MVHVPYRGSSAAYPDLMTGKVHVFFDNLSAPVLELIRAGKTAEGREVQLAQAGPLADRLERLTNELVNKAEADMVASTDSGARLAMRSASLMASSRRWCGAWRPVTRP